MPEPLQKIPPAKPADLTAKRFLAHMKRFQSDAERAKIQRYFRMEAGDYGHGDVFIGVRMGQLFELGKAYAAMPLPEIETLMESDIHEARAGAMSIMEKQSMLKTTDDAHRKKLFDLYLRRHDCINNWDLVDLAAKNVVGRHLADKPRKPLYKLARSKNPWERRTALYACLWFVMKQKNLDDTLAICEIMVREPEEIIQKAVGTLLRCCSVEPARLKAFLEMHAATMPRVMLRYAVEKLGPKDKARFMAMGR